MRADKRRHPRTAAAIVAALTVVGCGPTPKPKPVKPKPPTTEPWKLAIAAQVKPYIASEVVTGVAIGVIDGDRQWTYGFGVAGNGDAAPTATTLFELGAVTQVFTGVLIADAVDKREIDLTAPVATLLPLGVTAPTRDGVELTIDQLVQNSSGLPDLPAGLARVPAARYGLDALYIDLARAPLMFTPGKHVAYSTFGYAVLGAAVATKLGLPSWSAAIDTRVLAPLKMTDTAVAVPAGQSNRHAVGHADDGRVAPFGAVGALDAAVGLRSTVADQLKFLRANFDAAAGRDSTLAPALRRAQAALGTGALTADQAPIGWYVDDHGRRYHSGQTDGFHSFIELDLDKRHAVIVLAATATSLVDQLGDSIMDVLAGARPVPAKFPTAEQMMPLVGVYKVNDKVPLITIELDGKKLFAKTPDGSRSRLMPAGGVRFYVERDRAFVTFDGKAPAEKLLIETGGGQVVAARVVDPAPTRAP